MTLLNVLVVLGAILAIGWVNWYFLLSRRWASRGSTAAGVRSGGEP